MPLSPLPVLENYQEVVRSAILNRTGSPLLNGSVDHAAMITQEAFNNAKTSVRILSHKLHPDCYGKAGVLNAVKYFLADESHKVDILVESSLWDPANTFPWESHPLLGEIAASNRDMSGQVRVSRVPLKWAERYSFNFLIMDDYGFRFEEDRERPTAVAAFSPPNVKSPQVANLSGIFDRLWSDSEAIDYAKKQS